MLTQADSYSFHFRVSYEQCFEWFTATVAVNEKSEDEVISVKITVMSQNILNRHEKKLTASPSLIQILGMEPSGADNEELEKLWKQIHPEDRKKAMENLLNLTKNEEISLTLRVNDSKKRQRYFRCGIKCVVRNDIYVCYQGYAQDITEIMQPMVDLLLREEMEQQKKLEEAAEKANAANKAKSRFLSNMSHDIRTPLNGIIGLLKINETHKDDEILVKENRKKMETAADHLLSLVNDVLQMSKIEDGSETITNEPISLKKLASEIVAIIYESTIEKGIAWEYEGDKEPQYPYIMTSPLHLRQIFLNIYGNSVKFTKDGGTICTRQECLGAKDNIVTYRWTISDTGIGMSREFLEHVFEPFAQETQGARSNYTGTGLGLSIVKSLVDRMGGSISATSEQGKGTTFVVEIPFEIADESQILTEKTDEEPGDIHGLNLLLAEDNELNAEIAQMLLEDAGASVTVVSNGQEAVEKFRSNPAGTYHAILMDVQMPKLDGYTATREICTLDNPFVANIPIIAMTANAFEEDKRKSFEAGINGHLSKPIEIPKLMETLASILKKSKN